MNIDGFIQHSIQEFTRYNDISANLPNLDVLTKLPNLEDFRMEQCGLVGRIALSSPNKHLPYTLKDFDVEYNSFMVQLIGKYLVIIMILNHWN